jgi:hypothetical protein
LSAEPAPGFWFWLSWHADVVEPDLDAPRPERGQPPPMRTRRQDYARRVTAATRAQAQRMREWHLTHDSWLPAGAYDPDVSDVSEIKNRPTKGGTA